MTDARASTAAASWTRVRLVGMGFLRRLLGPTAETPAPGESGDSYLSAFRGLVLSDLSGELFDCKRDGPGHRHLSSLVSAEVLLREGQPGVDPWAGMPIGPPGSATQPPGGATPWTEFWTIDRCGDAISFYISFEPTPTEGTKITTRDASGKPASGS